MLNLQDLIAIATFAIAILGIIYGLAKRDFMLKELQKDFNSLNRKLENLQSELVRIVESQIRLEEWVSHLVKDFEDVDTRDNNIARSVKPSYKATNSTWYSENSGIEL